MRLSTAVLAGVGVLGAILTLAIAPLQGDDGDQPAATGAVPANPPSATPVPAAEAAPAPQPAAGTTIASLEARIARIRDNKELESELRDSLIETCTKAIEHLRAADEFAAKARDWEKTAEAAPAELEKIAAEAARPADQPASQILPGSGNSLASMQQALARAEADRDHRRQALEELNEENDRRSDRRQEIATRDEEIAQELREVEEALDRDPGADADEPAAQAQHALLQARRKSLVQEQEMHRQELLAFEATAELVSAQRDLAATRLQAAEDLVDAWQKSVNDFRRSEADRQLAESRERAAAVHPLLKEFADTNVALAEARRELASRIEETLAESEAAQERLDELREQYQKVTERARRIGFTEAIGLLLRKHRDTLSLIDESLRNKRARAASVSQMSVRLTDYEEDRARLADLSSRVRAEMAKLRGQVSETEAAAVQSELRTLLETQRRCLDSLIRDTTRYVEELMELETVERQLVECVREFAAFSDEHILWIRSANLPQAADGPKLAAAVRWLTSPPHWRKASQALARDAATNPWMFAQIGLLLASMAVARRWLARRCRRVGQSQERSRRLWQMSELVPPLLAAAWCPILIAFLGARLSASAEGDEFVSVLGRTLSSLAVPWLLAAGLVGLTARHGVIARQIVSDAAMLAQRRRLLRNALLAALPLAFLVLVTEAQFSEAPRNTLGRLSFVLLMGTWATAMLRLSRAAGTAHRTSEEQPRARLAAKAVWFVAVAAPVALAVASIVGYHYTALQLALGAVETSALAVCVAGLYAAGLRRMQNAGPLQLAVAGAGDSAGAASAEHDEAAAEAPADEIERPAAVFNQAQRLLALGSFVLFLIGSLVIWSRVFPVLTIMRSIRVWPLLPGWVDPAVVAEGATKIVTLAALLAALAITAVALAAARNVRAALEPTLFRYLPFDTGARYAVTAICRYAIALAGLFSAFSQLGIGWAQLNWLVAAMTVGLGFGLQEIFANFVSGLILLFERPVRIGDIVSVDGVTGTVSRIRIRATTITDGDMRELIIPNRKLITDRVINWTLSNTLARMTISVRTAHGVDPDKARNLLLAVATQHPLVLRQPPPQALFDEFSDKTQNFTLQVFMANCGVYPQLRHELLTAIQRTFRQAGINLNSSDAASLPVSVPHAA